MREEYDFSDAKRENPYIDKIKQNGYTIVINCGASQSKANVTDNNLSSADYVAEAKTKYKRKK